MESQCQQVISYMKDNHHITPKAAMIYLGVYRLAARIHELRNKGYLIQTDMIEGVGGRRYASYSLHGEPK